MDLSQSEVQDPMQDVPQEAPQAVPRDPMAGNTAEDDEFEVEARDKLGLRITLAADAMAQAAMAARGAGDAGSAENYAQATHKLVQSIVLLVPVTSADDIVSGAGLASADRARTDQ